MKRLVLGLSVLVGLCVLGVSTPAQAQTSAYWYGNSGRHSGYGRVTPQPQVRYDYWYGSNYRYAPRNYNRQAPRQNYGYASPYNYRYYNPGAGYVIPPQYRRPGYYGPSRMGPSGGFQPDRRSQYWNYGYQGQPYPRYYAPRRGW